MKKAWKWILGIVIILVVVAALVTVPFIMRNYMVSNAAVGGVPQARGWNNGPMMPGNRGSWEQAPNSKGFQRPQVPGFDGQRGPMIGRGRGFNRGFAGFGIGFMFLGGLMRLIPLALLGLLVYGVYQLGKRAGLRTNQAPMPTPAQPAPVPPVQVAEADNNEPPAA